LNERGITGTAGFTAPSLSRVGELAARGLPGWVYRIVFYYPFTLAGTILFAAALVVLTTSRTSGNAYGLVLSLLACTALILLSLAGRLQAARAGRGRFQWDSGKSLHAGPEETEQRAWVEDVKPLPLYRIHFRISGRFRVGRDAWMHVSREGSFAGNEQLVVGLSFPLSGVFHARGSLNLRDIFGLTRARFGTDEHRVLFVQPAPFAGFRPSPVEAVGGLEESQRRRRSDEERYYMREYIPGDRFRDINWKSSERLAQLITRISPHTQEKTRLISILFRHLRNTRRETETVESVVHLNQLKSMLLSFLRTVKREHPEYQFLVQTGDGPRRLETDEQIELFSQELSGVFFEPDQSVNPIDPNISEIFIFTTPYDADVHRVAAQYRRARIRIFRTAAPQGWEVGGDTPPLFGFPGRGFLPGPWVLFRDRKLPSPAIGPVSGTGDRTGITVDEYPLRVRLFKSQE
jgi:hypothetical protein